ncbi:MAG: DUF2142 domain-containing protein [Bifidobacteriaceae bacterium]|jgi:uncharacterized membrane protein|nr:DUF2142 domain-containing protein [Bifidobacteriaceae bacterium]
MVNIFKKINLDAFKDLVKNAKVIKNPAKIFLILSLLFGSLFIIFTPPGFNDDEPTHYIRVQQIANGQIFNDLKPYPVGVDDTRSDQNRLIGYGPIDINANNFINSFKFGQSYTMPFDKNLMLPQKYHSQAVLDITSGQATPNSPLTYAPLVAGTLIGKFFGLSLLNEFMLAKFLQLILCSCLIFLAIKIIPRGRWVLLAISILPMTLIQLTAYSHDGLTYSIAVILFAWVYKIIYYQEQITLKNAAILSSLTIALGCMKMTYLPVAALVLIIGFVNKNWHNIKSWLINISSILVSSFICLYLISKTDKANPDITITDVPVSPELQKEAILHNPIRFFKAITNSIFFQSYNYSAPNSDTYLHSRQQLTAFGAILSERVLLQPWFMLASIIGIILAIIITISKNNNNSFFDSSIISSSNNFENSYINKFVAKKSKLFIYARYLIPAICLALIYISLYLSISVPGETYVWGAQTRYWLPFLPLLLIPQYCQINLDQKIVNNLKTSLFWINIAVLADTVYTIHKAVIL